LVNSLAVLAASRSERAAMLTASSVIFFFVFCLVMQDFENFLDRMNFLCYKY
jgi:hypothetical protein